MATTGTADAWRQGGMRPDRSSPPAHAARLDRSADRAARPVRGGGPQRVRPDGAYRPAERARADAPRSRGVEPSRPDAHRPTARPAAPRGGAAARSRTAPAPEGGRARGFLVVLGMFLVTLAGAGVDSVTGIGLGLITLGALVGSTLLGAAMVRRRDLVSVLVAPPLVFMAVAAVNIGLAPSASFNLATVATLLVRGFPTMAIATGVALLVGVVRLVARR